MPYSDNPIINEEVELLMRDRMPHPWCPDGVPIPTKTRAEIIAEIGAEYGNVAAQSLRIAVH